MDPSHLKSIPLFSDIPDDELAKIATFAQEVTVEAGRELVIVLKHNLEDYDGDDRLHSETADITIKYRHTFRY